MARLPIEHDFTKFSRIDWDNQAEVGIRYLIELLAHLYGRRPEHIITALCQCAVDLPRLRYEEEESDKSAGWVLLRFYTVLHPDDTIPEIPVGLAVGKVLLSNTIESSRWESVPASSISCREEIKCRGSTYPDATVKELVFDSEDKTRGIREIIRIVTPQKQIALADCWAYRQEFENYLEQIPAFSDWLTLLPERADSDFPVVKPEKESINHKRRRELLDAAIDGLKSGELGVRPTVKKLLRYMRGKNYPHCNGEHIDVITQSIGRSGGNLFNDARYQAAVTRHSINNP